MAGKHQGKAGGGGTQSEGLKKGSGIARGAPSQQGVRVPDLSLICGLLETLEPGRSILRKGRWTSAASITRDLKGVHLIRSTRAGTLSSSGRKESPGPL